MLTQIFSGNFTSNELLGLNRNERLKIDLAFLVSKRFSFEIF